MSQEDSAAGEAVIRPVAFYRGGFEQKFGIPRQAGLVPEIIGRVEFHGEFAVADALRGIEDFSHLWLIWQFSKNLRDNWSPLVRPPRLGGNVHMGVFATRSPFRPNGLGLSCVKLLEVDGTSLVVGGADLADGTPIFDVKPYVAADCHPEAELGFTSQNTDYTLDVEIPDDIAARLPAELIAPLTGVLAQDPRPAYQRDSREYGLSYAGWNVRFKVAGDRLTVVEVSEE